MKAHTFSDFNFCCLPCEPPAETSWCTFVFSHIHPKLSDSDYLELNALLMQ